MKCQTLRIHTHWQVAQNLPSSQNLPKSMAALTHRGHNNGQHTTTGHTQLPGSSGANVYSLGFISG